VRVLEPPIPTTLSPNFGFSLITIKTIKQVSSIYRLKLWILLISALLEPPYRHLCRVIFTWFTRHYYNNIMISRKHASLYLILLPHFSFAKPNQGKEALVFKFVRILVAW